MCNFFDMTIDMFEDAATDAGDAMLMWEAILDKDPEHRAEAFRRVMRRYEARQAADELVLTAL